MERDQYHAGVKKIKEKDLFVDEVEGDRHFESEKFVKEERYGAEYVHPKRSTP